MEFFSQTKIDCGTDTLILFNGNGTSSTPNLSLRVAAGPPFPSRTMKTVGKFLDSFYAASILTENLCIYHLKNILQSEVNVTYWCKYLINKLNDQALQVPPNF